MSNRHQDGDNAYPYEAEDLAALGMSIKNADDEDELALEDEEEDLEEMNDEVGDDEEEEVEEEEEEEDEDELFKDVARLDESELYLGSDYEEGV